MKDVHAALLTQAGIAFIAAPIVAGAVVGTISGIWGILALLSFITGGFFVGYGWADHGN